MTAKRPAGRFTGPVEADETFVGGRKKNKHAHKKQRAGRGTVGKEIVAGVKDRTTGQVVTRHAPNTSAPVLASLIADATESGAQVFTDEHPGYRPLGSLGFGHSTVAHSLRRPHPQPRLAVEGCGCIFSGGVCPACRGPSCESLCCRGLGLWVPVAMADRAASAPAYLLCRSSVFLLFLAVVDGTSVLRDAGVGRARLRQILCLGTLCGFAPFSKHESRLLSWQSIRTFQQVEQLGRPRTPAVLGSTGRDWCQRGFRTRWPARAAPAAASWGSPPQ